MQISVKWRIIAELSPPHVIGCNTVSTTLTHGIIHVKIRVSICSNNSNDSNIYIYFFIRLCTCKRGCKSQSEGQCARDILVIKPRRRTQNNEWGAPFARPKENRFINWSSATDHVTRAKNATVLLHFISSHGSMARSPSLRRIPGDAARRNFTAPTPPPAKIRFHSVRY